MELKRKLDSTLNNWIHLKTWLPKSFRHRSLATFSTTSGEVGFLVENNGYVLPIEIKSGKPVGGLRYNHTALDYLFQVTPDIPCAFVFGETNIPGEGSKIWYYPIYLLPFLKKNDGLLRERLEHHFLGNS